mgnify:FL=1
MLDMLSRFLRTLLTPYDITDALQDLTVTVQEALRLHGAGVSINRSGELEFITAQPTALVELERHQQDVQAGPCIEAFRRGEIVAIRDLGDYRDRWPEYCQMAARMGLAAVAGIPMRVDSEPIGSLNLYDATARDWGKQDLSVARIFADAASVFLINSATYDRQRVLAEQLQEALSTRIVIEQAKGIIAQTHGTDVDEAFRRIRDHARARHSTLREVSQAIVDLGLRL